MNRHVVAVEHDSLIMSADTWRNALQKIFTEVAFSERLTSSLHLEPIPGEDEILSAFRSFDKLVKLKVKLRIPNPEVTRVTERLLNDMSEGGIREYVHQMYSPNGLNKSERAVPYATASLAQDGYKEGEVLMDGLINGKRKRIKTGLKAARTSVDSARDFARGALSAAKTKEAKKIVEDIIKRMDEAAPPPSDRNRKVSRAKRKR